MGREQNLSSSEPISYEGESENARYSVAVTPLGEVRGGVIVSLPSGDEGADSSNAIAYYNGSDLLSLSIAHHDTASLATYYASDRSVTPTDLYTFRAYYAPFSELSSLGEKRDNEEIYLEEGRVIYRKSDILDDGTSQKMVQIDFPYHLEDDITKILHREEERLPVADNEHSTELPAENKLIKDEDIPSKYRTSFYTTIIQK